MSFLLDQIYLAAKSIVFSGGGIGVELLSKSDDELVVHTDMATESATLKRIGIVLFDGFALQEAAAIVEVFESMNTLAEAAGQGGTQYETCLLSAGGGGVSSASSVFVWTEAIDTRIRFDALFIVGGEGVRKAKSDQRLTDWLGHAHAHCELVCPVGTGKALLEAAGVKQATHSMRYVEHIKELSREGGATGPAHTSDSQLQAVMDIVPNDLGCDVAQKIAHWVVAPTEGRFDPELRKSPEGYVSEKIQASARWLEANCERQVSINEAAQIAIMSERNFLRRFKMEIGVTPSDYLLHVRLDMSCRLLVTTNLPVDKIARRCGIGSGGQLAKLFRKHLATTPTEYRNNRRR